MQEMGQTTGGSNQQASASAEDVQNPQTARGQKTKAVVVDLTDD